MLGIIGAMDEEVARLKEMIEDHKTGILCSNIVEWKKKLTCLIENKELFDK